MSIFHNLIYKRQLPNGMWLSIDEKAKGMWIFRLTERIRKSAVNIQDPFKAACFVSEHAEQGPYECYTELVYKDDLFRDCFGQPVNLRLFAELYEYLGFNTVEFERHLMLEEDDPIPKVIKQSKYGGRAGRGNTMNFR